MKKKHRKRFERLERRVASLESLITAARLVEPTTVQTAEATTPTD